MWSGGFSTAVPAAGGAAPVDRAQLKAEQDRLSEEWERLREELKPEGDATRARQEADTDESYARRGFETANNELRGRQQALEGEERKREEFLNGQVKTLADRLTVSEERLRAAFDLAYFYQRKFAWDIESAIKQAVLEIFAENQNAWGEIIRAMHAAFLKFSDTIAGTRTSSASGMFSPSKYFNLKEPPQNRAPEQFAAANAQGRELEAERAQLEKIKDDKFYDEQVVKTKKELAIAEKEKKEAEAKYESAEARKKRVEAEFLAHRSRFSDIQEQMRVLSERLEAIREPTDDLPPALSPTAES